MEETVSDVAKVLGAQERPAGRRSGQAQDISDVSADVIYLKRERWRLLPPSFVAATATFLLLNPMLQGFYFFRVFFFSFLPLLSLRPISSCLRKKKKALAGLPTWTYSQVAKINISKCTRQHHSPPAHRSPSWNMLRLGLLLSVAAEGAIPQQMGSLTVILY